MIRALPRGQFFSFVHPVNEARSKYSRYLFRIPGYHSQLSIADKLKLVLFSAALGENVLIIWPNMSEWLWANVRAIGIAKNRHDDLVLV